MNPEQQRKWLEHVDQSITRRSHAIKKIRQERNSAEQPTNSEGDNPKETINAALNINLNAMDQDARFRNELALATDMTTVDSGAAVGVEIDGDEAETVLFMYNYGSLPDAQVVTPNSPLGEAISGLKAGDTTFYSIHNQEIPVTITTVE